MAKIPLHNIFGDLGLENVVIENEQDMEDFKAQLVELGKRLKLERKLREELEDETPEE